METKNPRTGQGAGASKSTAADNEAFTEKTMNAQQRTDARKLALAIGGRWHGRYGCAPCPVCQPEKRRDQNALTLSDGCAGLLLNCKKSGCDFRDILTAAGVQPGEYRRPHLVDIIRRNADAEKQAEKRAQAARRLWAETRPIEGSPAEAYLRSRGISCDLPDTLRFHPRCYHGPTQTRLPAMVAALAGGEGFAVHRTFLRADGSDKAGLAGSDKMMLGRVYGGAVRLSNTPGRLVVAEGIESALSLMCGLLSEPLTVWAALSTSGIRSLRLPEQTGQLAIATDGDRPGREAAQTLAKRAHGQGWHVSLLDPGDGRDFNDILNEQAVAA
jgi:hypothetical protein